MENQEKKNGGKSNIILIIFAVVIMIGVALWYCWYSIESKYFSTENAKVSASLYPINPTMPGKLVKLTVDAGDTVKENEIFGRVEGGTYLKSPVSGEVIKCDATINQTVTQATTIAVIADTSDLYIKANIEETDIAKIKEGQQVVLTMDAYPGKKFKAHVDTVEKLTQSALSSNPTSFSTSGTYTKVTQLIPVKIVVDENVELKKIIGTNAFVKIKIK